jgi:hypothetical protein
MIDVQICGFSLPMKRTTILARQCDLSSAFHYLLNLYVDESEAGSASYIGERQIHAEFEAFNPPAASCTVLGPLDGAERLPVRI